MGNQAATNMAGFFHSLGAATGGENVCSSALKSSRYVGEKR
jgi:hypothetical protein